MAPTRRLSRTASVATSVPDPSAAAIALENRAGVVAPLNVNRKIANAAAKRPAMCSAFVRAMGAPAAETAMTASSVSQGQVSGVRQAGHCRDHASAAAQQTNAQSTHASRLLIDWRGRLTIGRVSSNGAAHARTHVATNADALASRDVRRPTKM
jgi:hypothetical protein